MISRNKSAQLFEQAKKLFPGGVNSPVRAFKSVHGPPLFIKKGDGPYLIDEDDNQFVDFCCSWGPLIHGHNDSSIRMAVTSALENGTSFGAPSRLGNELGELIIHNHRYLGSLRFVSSGTEAVSSAIRLARGYTSKPKILKFEGCYHGHVDSLLVNAGSGLATFGVSSSAGIPESFVKETIVLKLNDLQAVEDTLRKWKDELACVIIEPVPANNGLLLQDTSFLVWLRKLCDDFGILLIFDEVISGFRIGFEGASEYYAVEADLYTFGKIIGGGFPVGAFGGSTEIMNKVAPLGPVYQAGTLSANPIAMAAGHASLTKCLREGFYEDLEFKTIGFCDRIRRHAREHDYPVRIIQIASIFWISFSRNRVISADQIDPMCNEYFKKLHAYLLDNGVYLGPSAYEVGFVSAAHDPDLLKDSAEIICKGLDHVFS